MHRSDANASYAFFRDDAAADNGCSYTTTFPYSGVGAPGAGAPPQDE